MFFHLFTPLGVSVRFPGQDAGDPSLFVLAVAAFISCAVLVYLNRNSAAPVATA